MVYLRYLFVRHVPPNSRLGGTKMDRKNTFNASNDRTKKDHDWVYGNEEKNGKQIEMICSENIITNLQFHIVKHGETDRNNIPDLAIEKKLIHKPDNFFQGRQGETNVVDTASVSPQLRDEYPKISDTLLIEDSPLVRSLMESSYTFQNKQDFERDSHDYALLGWEYYV